MAHRVYMAKGDLLQFPIEAVEAEAVGDRRIDLERFPRHAPTLFHPHGVERAHIVQAVGQLDQDDAHIPRHGQQHLAEVLRLRLFVALVLDAIELGNAIDELGSLLAEALGQLRLGDGGIFHHVVQQGGDQRLGIETPASQRLGDRQRMRNIGFAADPVLAAMRLGSENVGGLDLHGILGLEVTADQGSETFEVFRQIDRRMHVRRDDTWLVGN